MNVDSAGTIVSGTLAYMAWYSPTYSTADSKPGVLIYSRDNLKFIEDTGSALLDITSKSGAIISSRIEGSIKIFSESGKPWILLYRPVGANLPKDGVEGLNKLTGVTVTSALPQTGVASLAFGAGSKLAGATLGGSALTSIGALSLRKQHKQADLAVKKFLTALETANFTVKRNRINTYVLALIVMVLIGIFIGGLMLVITAIRKTSGIE